MNDNQLALLELLLEEAKYLMLKMWLDLGKNRSEWKQKIETWIEQKENL